MFDLGTAAAELGRLVRAVREDQLDDPTPCRDWHVAQLLAHVHEFATVFTVNARKQPVPPLDGLPDDWRRGISRQLDDLAAAWRAESAWQGRVSAGGIDMSAEQNALVAIEELVLHGWDLARATGQDVRVADDDLGGVERFQEEFAGPIAAGEGPYGAAVDLPADASRLDRVLGVAGRDPGWTP